MTDRYEKSWDGFWRAHPDQRGEAIWDSPAEVTVDSQVPLFKEHFDPRLPVLDLGCGSGTQTRALARHYPRAVGVDFAEPALTLARQCDEGTGVDYLQLDMRDPEAVAALASDLGECNVYMRGIIHQTDPADRPAVLDALVTLLGHSGHVFCVDLAPAAGPVLAELTARPEGTPPKVAAIFEHDLKPATIDEGALEESLTGVGLDIVTSGEVSLYCTETLPDGSTLELPMVYILARSEAA